MLTYKKLAASAVALMAIAAAGTATFAVASFPPESREAPAALAPVRSDEHAQTIAAMRPPKRTRPVIAVIGQNDGAEITDFVVPYGVLARSGLADVVAVAPEDRPIKLTPALMVEPDATTAEFDALYPDGADYVIVPKIEDPDDPAVVAWIQEQAATGAIIVGICAGTKTLSAAGFFTDRSATGHWYDIDALQVANPSMNWVQDRRYVVDGNVVTTTGVSASIPISLALVEAIGGSDRAAELAEELGASSWDARHESSAFYLDRTDFWTQIRNSARVWDFDTIGVPVEEGVDEIALALVADVYSRTRQSLAVSVADDLSPVTTRAGLELLPDYTFDSVEADLMLEPVSGQVPLQALDAALLEIEERYDSQTAAFIALQIEYAWPLVGQGSADEALAQADGGSS